MQDPEPYPNPQPVEATGVWPTPGAPTGSDSGSRNDPPTVRSSNSSRPVRASAEMIPIPLPRPGDRIESFELEESIGVGGMGAVFRALDTRLDRQVALKILPPEQAHDPEVVQRFYQEGRAAARLDHENIARVYTIDHDAKYHFIAFEYIEGTTIRQRVERNGPMSAGEAINFTLQIAGALVHAAERGVVHRDIKPSNIIVTPQGRAKLVDMGLARRFERGVDDGLTQSGMTLGTFDYISPEQARDPRDVDVRSDLYSLGCTLFHMLTGRPPFPEGTVLQKLLQHQEGAPPDVRALNPEVPADLANIIVKLMAKERDRRYQTPELLVRDLLTVAGALGLRSLSPEGLVWMSATHPPGWERHLVWGLPAVALAAVVFGLVWWGQDAGTPTPRLFPPDPFSATGPITKGPSASRTPNSPAANTPNTTSEATNGVTQSPAEALPRDISVESGEDLASILASAPPRSIVVLTDDGPYELKGGQGDRPTARLLDRDLTIKAEAGVRPVLRLAHAASPDERGSTAILDFFGGKVTLEDLAFVVEPGPRDIVAAAVRCESTELSLHRCVFRTTGSSSGDGRVAAVQILEPPSAERPPAVLADACHFDGKQAGILAQGPADLKLRDCTMGGAEPAVWFENAGVVGPVPAELRLQYVSLIAGAGPVFRFDGVAPRVRIDDSIIAPARDVDATLLAIDNPEGLDWRGRNNLYARIGVFLQPTTSRPGHHTVRSWDSWVESSGRTRETGSSSTPAKVWTEADPMQALAQDEWNPSRAFRLVSDLAGTSVLGARQGPFGMISYGNPKVASLTPEPRRDPGAVEAGTPAIPTTSPSDPAPKPMIVSDSTVDPSTIKSKMGDGVPEMPVMPPMGLEPSRQVTDPQNTVPAGPEKTTEVAERPTDSAPAAGVIRTPDQFLEALNRAEPTSAPLIIASDADWDLQSIRIRDHAKVTIKAQAGATRPRIRFRPSPADPKNPTVWSVWLDLRSGDVALQGIDLVLAQADSPRQGRWAGFGVWAGAELSLTDCTVSIEGDQLLSAAIVIPSGEPQGSKAGADAGASAAVVHLVDSLLRSGGDLFEVSPGRRLDLDLRNVVVSTGGSLVHAHGQPRGQTAQPLKITLNQVTARTAGGLVQLESAQDEPDLPVADVSAHDSILATTSQGAPLFRVDGQDTLTALSDRIRWEGHGVAYHEINAYRRDQSAQPGTVPKIYDQPSWMVAIGTKEAAPVHGNLKFHKEWQPGRMPWTLRRDDVQLNPDSPAARSGADLKRIPVAPDTPS